MSVHAHAPPTLTTSAPPYLKRRCIATTNLGATRHTVKNELGNFQSEYVHREPRQCSMGASPWLPEADYCATHLPADAVLLVQQRMELWNALEADVWAQVLAEHPYTPRGTA